MGILAVLDLLGIRFGQHLIHWHQQIPGVPVFDGPVQRTRIELCVEFRVHPAEGRCGFAVTRLQRANTLGTAHAVRLPEAHLALLEATHHVALIPYAHLGDQQDPLAIEMGQRASGVVQVPDVESVMEL